MSEISLIGVGIAIISNIITQIFLYIIGTLIATLYFENKWGITNRIIKHWHRWNNSELNISLLITYHSNVPFDALKEIVLNNLRKEYGQLKTYKNNDQKLEVMVKNAFHISVNSLPSEEISIQTSNITTHMKTVITNINNISNVLKNIKRDLKSTMCDYDETFFSIYLYLPFTLKYKFYTPKNIDIKHYEIKMFHKDHHSEINLNGDFLNINSKQKDDLIEVVKCFI